MGDPQHAHDEDRVRHAAELGGALNVITSLRDGFDTFLTRPVKDWYSGVPEGAPNYWSEKKVNYSGVEKKMGKKRDIELSGGQMQKLAV